VRRIFNKFYEAFSVWIPVRYIFNIILWGIFSVWFSKRRIVSVIL